MTRDIRCSSCIEKFYWNDVVIEVDDKFYHKECVEVFPCEFFAILDDEPLGVTENEDGLPAFETLEDGEYLEEED